eukprot:m51a1_g12183 hypothetical protein (121) ;mRNA; r:523-4514
MHKAVEPFEQRPPRVTEEVNREAECKQIVADVLAGVQQTLNDALRPQLAAIGSEIAGLKDAQQKLEGTVVEQQRQTAELVARQNRLEQQYARQAPNVEMAQHALGVMARMFGSLGSLGPQ